MQCQVFGESGVAEFVSAMAAGWNAQLIVETWSHGGAIPISIGLAIASHHTGGRHVCIVPDERSRLEYGQSMEEAAAGILNKPPEIMVGEAEEVIERLVGIDFMVVDSRQRDFSRVLRVAKLNAKGAVLLCKNANYCGLKWRGVLDQGSRRIVRSVFLPVGEGLDIAHVSAIGGNNSVSALKGSGKRWIKHVDQRTGEVLVIRK